MRWVVRLLSGVVMLIVVAVGLVFLIPSQKVADIATTQFAKATGRSLTIDGDVRPTIWPVLGVSTGPVQISNAEWSDAGPLLVAEGLAIGVDLAALIGGTIRVTKVEAMGPQILLERNAKGQANWEFGAPAASGTSGASGASATATPITLDHGLIQGGSLRYIDHGTNTRLHLTDIAAEVKLPDFNGPVTLSLAAQKDGRNLLVDAELARFSDFLAGRVTNAALSGGVGDSGFKYDGLLGTAPFVAEGEITADLADLGSIMGLVGLPAPVLPQGLGAQTRKISGKVTRTAKNTMHLRGGVIVLDDNRLEGDADVTLEGDRPTITASIKAGALDLSALGGGAGGGGASTGAQSDGWSRAPIDVSALGIADATISIAAQSLDLGTAKLGKTQVLMTLVRSRAVFEARELQAYGGQITGNFVVNGRGGLSVGGDLNFAGLSMEPLLKDVADFDRLLGTADFRLKFLGVGNSMAALANDLAGDGQFRFGKGELRGLDLAGMLRNLDMSYMGEGSKTIFDGMSASFAINKGVLFNEDLMLDAPYVTAKGAGKVGIGARTLDYRVVPVALSKEDGTGGISVPLLIGGTWASPKFSLDLKSLADQKLDEEKARLEAEAKARIEEKAASELGVVRQEGESLEDAAKRRAQEAAEKEAGKLLNKLFGGN
ncbi:MAG: AsmA family protein [Pseudorhodobacter sp.]|nr:AsmA family protein [Pseudorhodobacter sp.]